MIVIVLCATTTLPLRVLFLAYGPPNGPDHLCSVPLVIFGMGDIWRLRFHTRFSSLINLYVFPGRCFEKASTHLLSRFYTEERQGDIQDFV